MRPTNTCASTISRRARSTWRGSSLPSRRAERATDARAGPLAEVLEREPIACRLRRALASKHFVLIIVMELVTIQEAYDVRPRAEMHVAMEPAEGERFSPEFRRLDAFRAVIDALAERPERLRHLQRDEPRIIVAR